MFLAGHVKLLKLKVETQTKQFLFAYLAHVKEKSPSIYRLQPMNSIMSVLALIRRGNFTLPACGVFAISSRRVRVCLQLRCLGAARIICVGASGHAADLAIKFAAFLLAASPLLEALARQPFGAIMGPSVVPPTKTKPRLLRLNLSDAS